MSEQVKAGFYKGCRGILGSEQYGRSGQSGQGSEQIALDVNIPELERNFTTFLSFSDKAAPYSIERLRALGWTGDDISDLRGIDQNDVDVQIKYEMFEGKEQMRVQIATGGGGRIELKNVMTDRDKRDFSARMRAFLKGAPAAHSAAHSAAPAASRSVRREGAFDPGPEPSDDIPF